jgi:hypothetical protein
MDSITQRLVDRLYVPRKQVGRGLMQLGEAYAVEIKKLVEYADSKGDPLIHILRAHRHSINSAMLQTARCIQTDYRQNKINKGQHSREDKRKRKHEQIALTN